MLGVLGVRADPQPAITSTPNRTATAIGTRWRARRDIPPCFYRLPGRVGAAALWEPVRTVACDKESVDHLADTGCEARELVKREEHAGWGSSDRRFNERQVEVPAFLGNHFPEVEHAPLQGTRLGRQLAENLGHLQEAAVDDHQQRRPIQKPPLGARRKDCDTASHTRFLERSPVSTAAPRRSQS